MIVDNMESWYKLYDPFPLTKYYGEHTTTSSDFVNDPRDFMITRGEDSIILSSDLPGHPKEDINIEYEGGYIRLKAVTGNRTSTRSDYSGLLGDIDPDSITASYENGVITITLKKNKKNLHGKRTVRIE